MYTITLILVQILLNSNISQQCKVPTFRKNPVLVVESSSSKYQTVTGCITPKHLTYDPAQLKEIKVIAQDIRVLNEGAVEKIREKFQLSFYMNNISVVKSEAFKNLDAIDTIYLDKNSIKTIETNAFDSLPSLEVINLEMNELETIMQHAFAHLPNLTTVGLNDNKLRSFQQHWFFDTPRLQTLFIDDNLISALQKAAFVSIPALEYLTISSNKISHIHRDAFMGLDSLLELTLAKNYLKEIAVDFQATPNLRNLDLESNEINYLPDKMLRDLQHSLKAIWMFSNPWQCACLEKYIEWGGNYTIKILWKCKNTDLSCVLPKTEVNKCIPRSAEDFYDGSLGSFHEKCVKHHKA